MATAGEMALQRADVVLQRHFGHEGLRQFQRDAFAAWAEGRDVLVTLATGAGKSLCFQLPALCDPAGRFVLVISPLVALMQDQVRTLQQRQIPAGLCGSGAHGEIAATWSAMESGALRIVYMCPEYAMSNLDKLATLRSAICLLAVDEAHCVSSWGHDFRPRYRELGKLREVLTGVPMMGATATCTKEVRADIIKSLRLRANMANVNGDMNRPNLRYMIQPRTTVEADLGNLFQAAYCNESIKLRRAMPVDNTRVTPTSSAVVCGHQGTVRRYCCMASRAWYSSDAISRWSFDGSEADCPPRLYH
jgi:RecQ family ATP-dependent DNA helicase